MGEVGRRSVRAVALLLWCTAAGVSATDAAAQVAAGASEAETVEETAAAETRAGELRAMRREKAETLVPPEPPGTFELFLAGVQDYARSGGGSTGFLGFEPKTGGLKRGAGAAVGIRFAPFDPSARHHLQLDASVSSRRYWGAGGIAELRFGATNVLAYARYRHMPGERFFGFGPDSDAGALSEFRLNEAVGGGLLGVRLGSALSLGARSSYIVSMPGPGRDDDVTDAADRFAGLLPSLEVDVRHVAVGGWIEYDSRDPARASRFFRYMAPTETDLVGMPLATDRGLYALAEFVRYEDVSATDFSFSRINLQSQQFVPFRRGRNVFAFREYLTLSAGGRVPLYMAPVLGGAYTLRGFEQFRFRDRHALLVNAEYRWQAWLFLDLALFADAGQVFGTADELSLGGLDGSYGAGVRLRGADRGLARIDVGRSEEGTLIHIRLGANF